MRSSSTACALFVPLVALMMTADSGFAATNGGKPNTDLDLPTETPKKIRNFEVGTPTGMTEADCIKSGGTVGVNPNGIKVCAEKINVVPNLSLSPKPN